MVTSQSAKGKLGLVSLVAIGIGGMVGGGIFAVLGLATELAKGATPLAFLLAGLVALATSYSYAKLSVALPSRGGTVEFLNQAFGTGLVSGALNVLLWLSYVVMLSLYAHAFGAYAASFFPEAAQPFWRHVFLSLALCGLGLVNALGASLVGRLETLLVIIKLSILALFAVAGFFYIDWSRLSPVTWPSALNLVAGGMIIFLAYEGFELIANAGEDTADPARTLPKAYYLSVIIVIVLYVAIALVAVGNLPLEQLATARDYALAAAAQPFLGAFGFVLIAIAAVLSTGSAINATLYGAARLSYVIAKDGELPAFLEKKVWRKPLEGLILTTGAALLLANTLDLSSISVAGSAGFLLIFTAVNLASFHLSRHIGSSRLLSAVAALACLVALAALVWHTALYAVETLWALPLLVLLAFVIEATYRAFTGRTLRLHLSPLKARS